ncbi:MAG: hypothetical protein H0V82_00535 [Candidatus Protochlamydia sp.]|nr:hypothetical protein [Candidatus Protochlamydia sp.]
MARYILGIDPFLLANKSISQYGWSPLNFAAVCEDQKAALPLTIMLFRCKSRCQFDCFKGLWRRWGSSNRFPCWSKPSMDCGENE